tara:strand:- start:7354 stop:7629 length:276 start_codon:yes stop_codon:yes gene_type:complete
MSRSDQIVMIDNDVIDERIEIVKRQTSYSHDEAKAALQKNNYDVMSCIREYLEVPNKKQESKKSLNQQIYTELRGKLGSVSQQQIDQSKLK